MYVMTDPPAMLASAGELQAIGSSMVAGNAAAAAPTMGVVPPAADPTSALLAAAFATHGGVYQAAGSVATAIHEMFVATMGVSSGSYEATELLNALAAG